MSTTYYVCGFAFCRNKSIVILIEKKRPDWQAGKLNGIGGKMEPNEHPAEAMAREFEEETAVKTRPEDWHMYGLLDNPGWRGIVSFFRCDLTFEQEVALRTATDEIVRRVPVAAIQQANVMPNLNWLIPLALDNDVESATIIDRSVV